MSKQKKFKRKTKKRTYKKYNKTQFRNFKKHINLTSKMKGGGLKKYQVLPQSDSASSTVKGRRYLGDLETLRENIMNDTTFDVAGAPKGPPLYQDRTKEQLIELVNNVLLPEYDISDKEREELDAFIYHYTMKPHYERAFRSGGLPHATQTDSTTYRERIARVKTLIQNIGDDKPEEKVWLQTYLDLLENSTYFSYTQERKIEERLTDIEK